MDAIDKFLLSKSQQIHIKIVSVANNLEEVKVYFGSEPNLDLLKPIQRFIDAGAELSVYSTSKFKCLDLINTVYQSTEVAPVLIKTWKEQGYQVTVSELIVRGN